MTTTAHKSTAPPSFASAKMDERKRSLAVDMDVDVAPSRKRLAKDENGQPMRMDAEKEKDVEVSFALTSILAVCKGCGVLTSPSSELPKRLDTATDEGIQTREKGLRRTCIRAVEEVAIP